MHIYVERKPRHGLPIWRRSGRMTTMLWSSLVDDDEEEGVDKELLAPRRHKLPPRPSMLPLWSTTMRRNCPSDRRWVPPMASTPRGFPPPVAATPGSHLNATWPCSQLCLFIEARRHHRLPKARVWPLSHVWCVCVCGKEGEYGMA